MITLIHLINILPVCIHLLRTQNNNTINIKTNSNGIIAAKPNCIILAPTRELASQIENEAQKLTHSTTQNGDIIE